jgi:AcrR family transcriptional regulator
VDFSVRVRYVAGVPGPKQGRPPKVNRAAVVDAAVALADESGLPAVTIRGVAARLGVAPMTLYGHVANVDELVDLVVGATIAATGAGRSVRYRDGRHALTTFARGLRAMLVEHPAVLDAFRRRPVQDSTGLAVAEQVIGALIADGLDGDTAVEVYAGVYAYVVGFVALESRSTGTPDAGALAGHPTLVGVAGRFETMFDGVSFERGLRGLVDGALRTPAQ